VDRSALRDLDTPLTFNVAGDLAADLNFSRFDVGLDIRLLTDDQNVGRGNRPAEISVQMQCARKLKVSIHAGSIRKESGEFFGNRFVFLEHGYFSRRFDVLQIVK